MLLSSKVETIINLCIIIMINKKIYTVIGGTAFAIASVFAVTVFADDIKMEGKMERKIEKKTTRSGENLLDRLEKFEAKDFTFPQVSFERGATATLTINPRGHVRMTSTTVTAVSGDIVTVEIWKIAFSVHRMADTKVFAGNKKELTFEQIAVSDKVDVLGQLDDAKPLFVHAQSVHDRTQIGKANDEERNKLQALINELTERLRNLSKDRDKPHSSIRPSPSSSLSPSSSPPSSPSPSISPPPSPSPSVTPNPSASPSQSPT